MAETTLEIIKQRFEAKIDKTNPDHCWIWKASKLKDGYGCFCYGREKRAHRVSWILFNGIIPDGLSVLHHCDNPLCVNPEHLFIGTQKQNMEDMINKGRKISPHGTNLPQSKLTENQILEIRAKYIPRKYSLRKLANEYNVSKETIRPIVLKKTWKHI